MDTTNPVIQLCIDGSRAEYEGRLADARVLNGQAWELVSDDYEACIAAHYVARFQDSPQETLRCNQAALAHAGAVQDERVEAFFASLYLNLSKSYEDLGDLAEAQRYYDLAAGLGAAHRDK
jgi:hypothetical protein